MKMSPFLGRLLCAIVLGSACKHRTLNESVADSILPIDAATTHSECPFEDVEI